MEKLWRKVAKAFKPHKKNPCHAGQDPATTQTSTSAQEQQKPEELQGNLHTESPSPASQQQVKHDIVQKKVSLDSNASGSLWRKDKGKDKKDGKGTFPPFAVKSIVGQRFAMEDTWAAVPELVIVPPSWIADRHQDHLPTLPPKPETVPANAAETTPSQPTADIDSAAEGPVDSASRQASDQLHGEPAHFFAVFDGHGGADVAKHCAKKLHEHLRTLVPSKDYCPGDTSAATSRTTSPLGQAATVVESQERSSSASIHTVAAQAAGLEGALVEAFLRVDQELAHDKTAHEMGTTAVVALLGIHHLWVANCGDSRAIICRNGEAVAMSLDHKASRTDELMRVEQAGGYVWWDRVMGELAVSRAIGDHCLRPFVIAEPEITRVVRRATDQLLILASDGLWDVFTNQEAAAIALQKFTEELRKTTDPKAAVKKAASSLAKTALSRGSRDNITVLCVDIRFEGSSSPSQALQAAGSAGTPIITDEQAKRPATFFWQQ